MELEYNGDHNSLEDLMLNTPCVHSDILLFTIQDISGSIALSEDFEYSLRSFLCQFSNEWHGRTIE